MFADFTLPYAEGGLTSVVPITYEDENGITTFVKPLTKELWLTTALLYTSTALAAWILARGIANPPGQHAGLIAYFPFFPGDSPPTRLFFSLMLMLKSSILSATPILEQN